MWSLEDGINVVRALQQPIRKYGYHLVIGGGVVNKGKSNKDLDLYFLPMGGFDKQTKVDPDNLLIFLREIWGHEQPLNEDYPYDGTGLFKKAVKFFRSGHNPNIRNKRIDCFIF